MPVDDYHDKPLIAFPSIATVFVGDIIFNRWYYLLIPIIFACFVWRQYR